MAQPDTLPLAADKWSRIAQRLQLSPQQKRIVEAILLAKCDKQIAATMQIGKPTVRDYLSRIFLRTGVKSRQELVLLILRMLSDMDDG